MDEYRKINLDSFHHRSSSAKNIKGSNSKKNSNINISNEFTKITTIGTTNTSGTQPIIIYKKELNTHSNNIKQIKMNSKNKKNNNIYISDGGLKKKLDRFHGGHSYSIPNKKSSSMKNGKKSKKYYPKKKLLKSSTQEKLFSQTMVGSFKRPNIPKKEKNNKMKNNPMTNSLNENKEKNKENKKINKSLKIQHKNLSEINMEDLENKKLERMNKLVENAIVYEMRKNQMENENRQLTLKDKISFRKKGYLETNGIETTWTIDEIQESDGNEKGKKNEKEKLSEKEKEKTKFENNNNEKKDFKTKLTKKQKTEINSNSHTINIGSSNYFNNNNYNNFINSNEENQLTLDITKKRKPKLKPKVNQFEFIKKIQIEQKKLPFHIETSNHNKRQLNKNLSTSSKINDSFRHKSATYKSNENNKINSSENNIFDINESKPIKKYTTIQFEENSENTEDFPFAKKKHNRKPQELNEFIRRKKIKEKKQEENKEYEKKKKLFEIFKNLSNLKDSYNTNYTNINNSISIFRRRNRKNMLKHKEINAYYIGIDSSRNGSTILDLNEYYLNILESQQLLVNSGLNKITDLSLSLENNENNKNNDMLLELNTNNNKNILYGNYNNEEIKQINNILKNTNNINEDIINDNELSMRINETIKRANDIISQNNFKDKSENNNEEKRKNKNEEVNKNTNSHNKRGKEKKLENINLDNINNDDKNNTTSELNTKEKNLPSLPHTFSINSNPNKRIEIEIQPSAVLNLVEIIRLIFQRKVFFKFCINYSFTQRYILAFSYFVAIFKQFPFKTIEDYCNYKTYYYAFRQLFRPFIRQNYKKFLNNCISVTKIGYFVELLSRMFKFKSMERIYIYSQLKEENDQLRAISGIVMKIVLTLIRPHLQSHFKELCYKMKNSKKIEKDKEKPNLNIDIDNFEIDNYFQKKKNNSNRFNSFIYESFDSKSNYSVHPNSVDNDILHQLQNYLVEKNKINLKEKSKIIKNLREGLLNDEEESNKSQENLYHPKRNNNIKINFSNPQEINEIKKKPEPKKDIKNKKEEIKNKNNLILDIKKEDTNEFSPINKNMLNNKDDKKDDNKNNKNEQKIKIEKIKIIKSNNDENENNNINDKQNIKKDKDVVNDKDNKNKNKKNEKINDEKYDKDDKDNSKPNSSKISNKDKSNDNEIKKERNKEISSESQVDSDISAEKDPTNSILWEYNILAPSINNLDNEKNKENEKQNNKKVQDSVKEEDNEEPEKQDKIKEEKNIKKDEGKNDEKNKNMKEEKKEDIIEGIIEGKKEDIKDNKKEDKIEGVIEGKKEDKKDNKKEDKIEGIIEGKKEDKKEDNKIELKEDKKEEKNTNEDDIFDMEDILLSDENNRKQEEEEKEKILNMKKNLEINNSKNENQNKDINLVIKQFTFIQPDQTPEKKEIKTTKKDEKKELPKNFPDDLTEQIIKELISNEIIKKGDSLLPTKTYKYEKIDLNLSNNFLNNSGSLNFRENMIRDGSIQTQNTLPYRDNSFPNFYLNESMMSSISASSIFNRTIKDKKKEKSLLLYLRKIAPILIKLIQEEIYIKYPRIYENISIPLINNYKEIMVALELQNGEMIRDNYKRYMIKEEISDIIDKEKILKRIEPFNKEIRNKDNISDDNYYDKMLNECIIDAAIEIIKKERLYGEDGEPLPWSGRTRELLYKYEKNKPKELVDYVTEQLIHILNTKIGLINSNYEYLTQEQINTEKEKRLIRTLKEELKEHEPHWNNLEIEETQLKIEITEIINEQLYNEVMEILEHISLSRKKPELYQNKSIFVCEEIPKLSFQQNSTENKGIGLNGEENDIINIE